MERSEIRATVIASEAKQSNPLRHSVARVSANLESRNFGFDAFASPRNDGAEM
jgi:hypothetical protein